MSHRPSWQRVWGAGAPPSLCDNCHREKPLWFISTITAPGNPKASLYYCGLCIVRLFAGALHDAGFVVVHRNDVIHLELGYDLEPPENTIEWWHKRGKSN